MRLLVRRRHPDVRLLTAFRKRDLAATRFWLRAGGDPERNYPRQWGPLAGAAYHGEVPMLRLFLAHGANPNSGRAGVPLLILAANMGRAEAVRVLLDAGADLYAVDDYAQWNALTYAVHPDAPVTEGHASVIRALLDGGCDPNARVAGEIQQTPLMLLMWGDLTAFQLLLDAGADPNVRDARGSSPLHYAARNADAVLVRALIELGIEVDLRTHGGETALMRAVDAYQRQDVSPAEVDQTISVLLQSGTDPHAADATGETPLQRSLRLGSHHLRSMLEP